MKTKEILELVDSLPDETKLFTITMDDDGNLIIRLKELPGNRRLAKSVMGWLRKRTLVHMRASLHRDLLREHYKITRDARDGLQAQVLDGDAELLQYENDPDIQDMKDGN